MPTVTVKLYATLRERARTARVDVQARTAGEAVRALREAAAARLSEVLFDGAGGIRPGFLICLNAVPLDRRRLDATPVSDGDTLHVMPPIAGGATDVVVGIVLAGGDSRRMGRPKSLLPYEGTTFLEAVLGSLGRAGIRERIVVAGRDAPLLTPLVGRHGAWLVVNPDPDRGQLSSLQAALAAVEADAYVVGLVDMPAVSSLTMRALVAAWREHRAGSGGRPVCVKPTYRGKAGHPFVLDGTLRTHALALPPGAQTRAVLSPVARGDGPLLCVEVDDPAVLSDVDTPTDYDHLVAPRGGA